MPIAELTDDITVAVLCGGPGAERDVSLQSGEVIHQALLRAGCANTKVVIPAERPGDFLNTVECGLAVMMLHGEWGEDGRAQTILEQRNIPFTGSDSAVSALAMDKNACKRLCVHNGLPTPRWVAVETVDEAMGLVEKAQLSTPLFVKPNFRGSSVGASRVEHLRDLPRAVENGLAADSLVLVEELVTGREITIGWFAGQILPIIELATSGVFYDYEAKYLSEATRYICPARLDMDTASLVRRHAAKMVELVGVRDSARVDMMLGPDGPQILEINTLPGCTTHSLLPMAAAAAGMSLEQMAVRLVEMAARRAGII